jgi:hypothetical protein
MTDVFQISKLLNKYYEKVGRANTGENTCPVFTQFQAGYGYVNEAVPEGEPPVILSVPADLEAVPGALYTGDVETEYSNGNVVVKCVVPPGAVSEPRKVNVYGVYDQDNDLVAISVTLPDWMTPTETHVAYPTLNFPMEAVEE